MVSSPLICGATTRYVLVSPHWRAGGAKAARDLSAFLSSTAQYEMRQEDEARRRGGLLISTINGQAAHLHPLSGFLQDAGFQAAPLGLNVRRIPLPVETASAEVQ